MMKNHKDLYWTISLILVSLVRSQEVNLDVPCRLEKSSENKLVCAVYPANITTPQLEGQFLAAYEFSTPSEVFYRNHITNVSIFGNLFSGFGENVFRGFTELKELRIQRSITGEIPENLLIDSKALVLIIISRSNFMKLYPQTFQGMNQLTSLEISRNPYLSDIPKDLFHDLINLKMLALFNQPLTTLETETFSTLHNMEILKLYNNFFGSLPAGIFTNNTKLKYLSLHSNQLKTINEEWFASTKYIEYINLSANKITEIPENAFRNLEMLQTLKLDSNKIAAISENLFSDLISVHNLGLSSNNISDLPTSVFENKTHLQHLTLNKNKLTHIHSDLLKGLCNLEYLLLDSNKIEDIGEGVFRDCLALKTLKLNSNKLRKIDRLFIGGMENLEVLYLDHNLILVLEEGCFSLNGSHLKKIFLNNNLLNVLPTGAFSELQQLKRVQLNNNILNDIRPNVFPSAALDFVDLKNNLLTMSVEEIINNIPNVKSVALDKEYYYHEDKMYKIGNRTFSLLDGVWTNEE